MNIQNKVKELGFNQIYDSDAYTLPLSLTIVITGREIRTNRELPKIKALLLSRLEAHRIRLGELLDQKCKEIEEAFK